MKITLKDIATDELLLTSTIVKLFEKHSIKNCDDLYNSIFLNNNKELSTKQNLQYINRSLELIGKVETKNPHGFLEEFPIFKSFDADHTTKAAHLPVLTMHMHFNANYKQYSHDSIADVKRNLTKLDSRGNLIFQTDLKALKTRDIIHIIEMLHFYDEYAEEHIKINNYLPSDFLVKHFDLKREIVVQNKKEIVSNLLSMSDEFIFGNVSDKQKAEIMMGIDGYARGMYKSESLLDIVSRYSMIYELCENETNPNSLKRLVKR